MSVTKFVFFALLGAAAASSAVAHTPPYDGTGSHYAGPEIPHDEDDYLKDKDELEAWERRLLTSAKHRPEAMVVLGRIREQGVVGGKLDPVQAYDLYQTAADMGHLYGQERMCVAYILGMGRPRDLNAGFGYCAKLPQNNAVRLFSDGYDYAQGLRGPKDEDGAAALYLESAEKGGAEAMTALGDMAIAKSRSDAARKWFRQASIHGSVTGIVRYAEMVEAGQGGSADPALARWLYINASRLGSPEAKAWLDARPDQPPLPRVTVETDMITESIIDAKGTRTKPLKIDLQTLADYYPTLAVVKEVEATVAVHCYVKSDQQIDLCLITNECPPGYGFGLTIAALYNGNLIVNALDKYGQATANSVFAYNFKWKM